jgi:hypothetical protein
MKDEKWLKRVINKYITIYIYGENSMFLSNLNISSILVVKKKFWKEDEQIQNNKVIAQNNRYRTEWERWRKKLKNVTGKRRNHAQDKNTM